MKSLNVYALTYSIHIHHAAAAEQDGFVERGGQQPIIVAATDGAEAQEFVRALRGGENREVVFHGGPSLIVGGVYVVPSSWHNEPQAGKDELPSADDLDRVEAEKAAAAATGEGEDASL